MTPQEKKARELVEKFLNQISVRDVHRNETAKQCALTHIKELEEMDMPFSEFEDAEDFYNELEEVKQAINNL